MENQINTDNSEDQTVIFINYSRKYDSQFDSSVDNCCSVLEKKTTEKKSHRKTWTLQTATQNVICFSILGVGVP